MATSFLHTEKMDRENANFATETKNPFPHKEYDITPICTQLLCFLGAPYKIMLNLEPEFAFVETKNICGSNRSRIPYGEMNVDKLTQCCFVSVNGWSPGCGCDSETVDQIAHDLQARVGARGITGQLQKTEIMMEHLQRLEKKMSEIDRKLDLLLEAKSNNNKI